MPKTFDYDSYVASIGQSARLAISAIGKLGRVYVAMPEAESQALENAGVDVAAEFSRNGIGRILQGRSNVLDFSLRRHGDALSVDGVGEVRSTENASRGRHVWNVALWGKATEMKNADFNPRLGPAYLAFLTGSDPSTTIRREVSDFPADSQIGAWRFILTRAVDETLDLDSVVGSFGVARAHEVGRHSKNTRVGAGTAAQRVHRAHAQCRNCHEMAYASWQDSKHSGSLDTLLATGRWRDVRCLSCHVNGFHFGAGRPEILDIDAAVTCMTCHSKTDVRQTCSECHTPVADPVQHHVGREQQVCKGVWDRPTGHCSRSDSRHESDHAKGVGHE
jgi:hypothetical protein